MQQLKINLPGRRNTIKIFFREGEYKSPDRHFGSYQKKIKQIKRLKQELEQKKFASYRSSLDQKSKQALSLEISDLYEQINDLEWAVMSVKEKKRIKHIAEKMRKKFEVSEGIINQDEESPE